MKNNILLVGPSPFLLGGIPTCVRIFLKSNLRVRYNLKYFRTGKDQPGSIGHIPTIMRTVNQLRCFISKHLMEKIDITHIHTSSWGGFWRFGFYVFFCKIFNKKVILHIHGAEFKLFFSSNNFFMRKLIVDILESTESLIVLSNHWKKFFDSIAPKVVKKVVENSVSLPKSQMSRFHSSSTMNVLFLGGLTARKGVNELLQAIPHITNSNKHVRFIIAGFPSERGLFERLQNEAEDGEIDLRINVSENEKEQLYESSHIFVLQSFDEGLPFTILEAMSYGLPIITTPVGAIPEVVEDNKNGFIIQSGEYKELVERVLFLIENPEIRETMGDNNVNKIKEHFSCEGMIDKIDKFYQTVLNQKNSKLLP